MTLLLAPATLRVLLVEDHAADQRRLAVAFGAHAPHVTLTACASAAEARQVLCGGAARPHLLLLALPGQGGWALLAHLKADPELRLIPVVVLSAPGDAAAVGQAYAAHASACLVKERDPAGVRAQVAALVAFWAGPMTRRWSDPQR